MARKKLGGTLDRKFELAFEREVNKQKKKGRRISGDMMRDVSKEVVRRMVAENTSNLLVEASANFKTLESDIIENMPESTPNGGFGDVLPQNCRMYYHSEYTSLYVIEQVPQVRTFFVSKGYDNRKPVHVSLPYVEFLIWMNHYKKSKSAYGADGIHMSCSFRNAPLTKPSDKLYKPYLPNLYENNHVCLGDYDGRTSADRLKGVNQILQYFYRTAFEGEAKHWNGNRSASPTCPKGYSISSWADWAKSTKKDPLFIMKTKWKGRTETLQSLVKQIMGNDPTIRGTQSAVRRAMAKFQRDLTKT